MTDEERQLIQGLADRIRNAPAPQIDHDADSLIRQSFGSRPDALYILTQTVLIQEMALNQAKQQIEQLKSHPPQTPASFLPNRPAPPPPARPAGAYQNSAYSTSYQAPPQPPPLPSQYVVVEQQSSGGRFSGFLQNAAETAAGVVAGELAFSALSSMFGHGGGYYGGGGFFGGGGYYSPGSETIINNNYYEDGPRGGGNFAGGNDSGLDSRPDTGLSPDLEDRRFADDNSTTDEDTTNVDDSQTDDSIDSDSSDSDTDDSSSYDDGSGSDDQ